MCRGDRAGSAARAPILPRGRRVGRRTPRFGPPGRHGCGITDDTGRPGGHRFRRRLMKTIHVRTKLESDTLHLPELRDLIGKHVEITVREESPSRRDEFYAELGRVPETEEAFAAQAATFRAWRADPGF